MLRWCRSCVRLQIQSYSILDYIFLQIRASSMRRLLLDFMRCVLTMYSSLKKRREIDFIFSAKHVVFPIKFSQIRCLIKNKSNREKWNSNTTISNHTYFMLSHINSNFIVWMIYPCICWGNTISWSIYPFFVLICEQVNLMYWCNSEMIWETLRVKSLLLNLIQRPIVINEQNFKKMSWFIQLLSVHRIYNNIW